MEIKSIFSSLANPAASGEECARYRGSTVGEKPTKTAWVRRYADWPNPGCHFWFSLTLPVNTHNYISELMFFHLSSIRPSHHGFFQTPAAFG
jgi:hypothetical protein